MTINCDWFVNINVRMDKRYGNLKDVDNTNFVSLPQMDCPKLPARRFIMQIGLMCFSVTASLRF